MAKYPYNDDQVKVVGEERSFLGSIPVYNYPCSRKEAMKATYIDKQPVWLLTGGEGTFFCPSVIPDDIARGFVFEGRPWPEKYIGHARVGLRRTAALGPLRRESGAGAQCENHQNCHQLLHSIVSPSRSFLATITNLPLRCRARLQVVSVMNSSPNLASTPVS